jgi:hypothetical protein
LALCNDQWHALVRHLDGVRMPELMRREPSSHARLCCGAPQLRAEDGCQCRPAVAPRITQSSAPTGNWRRMASHGSD